MFKYVIAFLALIVAVLAKPGPNPALVVPAATTYTNTFVPGSAAIQYSSGFYPAAYNAYPYAYGAGYPYAYSYL